jgi:hypothetical protein
MKKIQNRYYILFLFIVLGCQNAKYNWFSGDFEAAKSTAGSKLILLDFYTDT